MSNDGLVTAVDFAFEQLLAEFRQAWCDFGGVYHMIDLYAPDPYDSRNLPFDRDKCDSPKYKRNQNKRALFDEARSFCPRRLQF